MPNHNTVIIVYRVVLTHKSADTYVVMTHIWYDTQVVCVILGDIRLTRVRESK